MTKRMIEKKLAKANISTHFMTIENDSIEIFVTDKDGDKMYGVQEILVEKVEKVIGFKRGFGTGYGAWILKNTPYPAYNR